MGRKNKSGNRKKSSTETYRKRQRRERENREFKQEETIKRESDRFHAEADFAQRIQSEPSLKEVI